jgi:pyruvate-formate lyase-activating enzyme
MAAEPPDLATLAGSVDTEHFIIMLTEKCNLRCVFCHQVAWDAEHHARVEVEWDLLASLVPVLKRRGTRRVTLGGAGEVTVSPQWARLAELLLAEGISVALLSNLSRPLSGRELEIVSECQQVTVSIDSVDPAIYHRLRWPGEVGTVLGNMERLAALRQRKNTRQPLDWNCIVADATVSGLVQYVRTGLALGVGNFNFLELLKHGSLETIGAANRLDHAYSLPPGPLAQARETLHAALALITGAGARYQIPPALLERMDRAGQAYAEPAGFGPLFQPLPPSHTRLCLDAWKTGFLNADGAVTCCCASGAADSPISAGTQLDQALSGGGIQRIREGLLSGDLAPACRTCSHPAVTLDVERDAVHALHLRRARWDAAYAAVSDLAAAARAGRQSILVYGAGLDASTLLACTDLPHADVCGICDPDPLEWGAWLKGFSVQPPACIEALRPDVILLSSARDHLEHGRQLASLGIRVVDPHAALSCGGPEEAP